MTGRDALAAARLTAAMDGWRIDGPLGVAFSEAGHAEYVALLLAALDAAGLTIAPKGAAARDEADRAVGAQHPDGVVIARVDIYRGENHLGGGVTVLPGADGGSVMQALADGVALAALREALPMGWGFSVAGDGPGYVARATSHQGIEAEAWSACQDAMHLVGGDPCDCPTPTIAEAADAARLALEGGR